MGTAEALTTTAVGVGEGQQRYENKACVGLPRFKTLCNGHNVICPACHCGFTEGLDAPKASKMLCKEKVEGGIQPL